MALTFTRALLTSANVTNATVSATAGTTLSAEIDIGSNTIAEQTWLYCDSTWGSSPGGNEQMLVEIHAAHTTAGTAYSDQVVQHAFSATAGQTYNWSVPLPSLPRFFKIKVTNDSNVEATSVDVRIELNKVTA